jgi:hypothetical protein
MNPSPSATCRSTGPRKSLSRSRRQLLIDARATILLNVAQTYYQVVICNMRQVGVLEHSLSPAGWPGWPGPGGTLQASAWPWTLDVAQAQVRRGGHAGAAEPGLQRRAKRPADAGDPDRRPAGRRAPGGPGAWCRIPPSRRRNTMSSRALSRAGRTFWPHGDAVKEARYAVEAADRRVLSRPSRSTPRHYLYLKRELRGCQQVERDPDGKPSPSSPEDAIRADVRDAWSQAAGRRRSSSPTCGGRSSRASAPPTTTS